MSRLTITDTIKDVVVKMSDGNPGAITVMMSILKDGRDIDPYTEPGMHLLNLDDLELYGSRIWLLYKDLCGQSLAATMGMLRAKQLGHISREKLIGFIDAAEEGTLHEMTLGEGFDPEPYLKKVQEELPNGKFLELE